MTPVFIFSYLDSDGINTELQNAGLLDADDGHSFIHVRRKADLKRTANQPLLAAVNAWIAGNPAIYVLSRWRTAVGQSQTRLFWDLYDKDHNWPGVLWRAYQSEGDDPEHGLADILLRNMRARLAPLALNPQSVAPTTGLESDRATTQAILEASMVVPNASLPPRQYGSGDVFEDKKKSIFVNVRCDCDCLARPEGDPNKVVLYLLHAQTMSDAKFMKEHWHAEYGLIQPNAKYHVLFLFRGKALRVGFREIRQVAVGDLEKEGLTRIARITPPYITQIRQRFALHLQREGLPRIPDAALPPSPTATDPSTVSGTAGAAPISACPPETTIKLSRE